MSGSMPGGFPALTGREGNGLGLLSQVLYFTAASFPLAPNPQSSQKATVRYMQEATGSGSQTLPVTLWTDMLAASRLARGGILLLRDSEPPSFQA